MSSEDEFQRPIEGIKIQGYKSIRALDAFELRPLTSSSVRMARGRATSSASFDCSLPSHGKVSSERSLAQVGRICCCSSDVNRPR